MSDTAALRALRLRTPRLVLRLATDPELRALARLAQEGVHDPGEMPFAVAWTDRLESPTFEEEFLAFHEGRRTESASDGWHLELITFVDGQPVGSQGVGAEHFARDGTVTTGSWLGRAWQGQGIGTEQRAAVLVLAFDGLGANIAVSGAWERNHASLGVSRKLGYVDAGVEVAYPRGDPMPHRIMRLERDAFRSPFPVELEGVDAVRAHLGIDELD
jgi:RimJ/RimL family protein N-acetyltransferase